MFVVFRTDNVIGDRTLEFPVDVYLISGVHLVLEECHLCCRHSISFPRNLRPSACFASKSFPYRSCEGGFSNTPMSDRLLVLSFYN